MATATKKQFDSAFKAVTEHYPESKKAIMCIKRSLPANAEYAYEKLRTIAQYGASQEGDFIYYIDAEFEFYKYQKEIQKFFAVYCEAFETSSLKMFSEYVHLSDYSIDEIGEGYYHKKPTKREKGWRCIVANIFQMFVTIVCQDVEAELKNMLQ